MKGVEIFLCSFTLRRMKSVGKKQVEYGDMVKITSLVTGSSIAFDKRLSRLAAAIFASPQYFTNEVIISVYHYIVTGEQLSANEIVGDVESKIVGRGQLYNTDYLLDIITDGEWIDYNLPLQFKYLAFHLCFRLGEEVYKDDVK